MNNRVIALNKADESHQPVQPTSIQTNFAPRNFNELMTFSNMAAKSNLVPISYRNKSADILLSIQMGAELGLAPMQSLQNIAVINGRPSIYGDAMIALCRSSPLCESIDEYFEGDDINELTALCVVKRKGQKKEIIGTFSWKDAQKAGLATKSGPWLNYPKRMLQMRARGFALRDAFPDLLRGLISYEEAADYPDENLNKVNQTNQNKINAETRINNETEIIDASVQQKVGEQENRKEKYVSDLKSNIQKARSREELERLTSNAVVIRARKKLRNNDPEIDEEIQNLIESRLNGFNEIIEEMPEINFPGEYGNSQYPPEDNDEEFNYGR